MTEATNDKLNAAILRAQGRIKPLQKASRNAFAGYDYASAEDVIQAAREALIAEGVLVTPGSWSVVRNGDHTDVSAFVYVCGHGGRFTAHFDFPAEVGKGKPLDKAVAGALTMGLREWLRVFLLIPRVDVEEPDARDDRPVAPPKKTFSTKEFAPAPVAPSESTPLNQVQHTPLDILAELLRAKAGDKVALERARVALNAMPADERAQYKDTFLAAKAACA